MRRARRRRGTQGTYGNQQGSLGTQGNAGARDAVQQTASYQAPIQPRLPDWQEQQAMIGANRNVALSNANATYQTGEINRDFGDLTGGFDPNNPYSRASLFEQNYKQDQAGDKNSYAAQGQLYSGAYQNANDENIRQRSIGLDQLTKQRDSSLYGIKRDQLSTYANAGSAVSEESIQALLRALGNR